MSPYCFLSTPSVLHSSLLLSLLCKLSWSLPSTPSLFHCFVLSMALSYPFLSSLFTSSVCPCRFCLSVRFLQGFLKFWFMPYTAHSVFLALSSLPSLSGKHLPSFLNSRVVRFDVLTLSSFSSSHFSPLCFRHFGPFLSPDDAWLREANRRWSGGCGIIVNGLGKEYVS